MAVLEAIKNNPRIEGIEVIPGQEVHPINISTYWVDNGGKTALHMAAWKGPTRHITLLLEYGADIDIWSTGIGNYGKTAIFYAITQCRDESVMELVNRGANVKVINNKGQTPRSMAYSHLKRDTLAAIDQAEQNQQDREWLNFRATHSDGRIYGDLDPRFIDKVTELLVLPVVFLVCIVCTGCIGCIVCIECIGCIGCIVVCRTRTLHEGRILPILHRHEIRL